MELDQAFNNLVQLQEQIVVFRMSSLPCIFSAIDR